MPDALPQKSEPRARRHHEPAPTLNCPPAGGGKTYLTARMVCARYGGRSKMWIERRLADGSGFPEPAFYVAGKRFWDLEALEQWERTLSREPPGWLLTVEKGKPFGKQVDGQDKKIEDEPVAKE
jgi:hypothetical protein